MRVECYRCGILYDDEKYHSICPHDDLSKIKARKPLRDRNYTRLQILPEEHPSKLKYLTSGEIFELIIAIGYNGAIAVVNAPPEFINMEISEDCAMFDKELSKNDIFPGIYKVKVQYISKYTDSFKYEYKVKEILECTSNIGFPIGREKSS